MAYRTDLYHAGNIIGYTGQLHRLPTVYFRNDALQLYGRITQQHRYSFNVGRAQPSSTVGYTMQNEQINGRTALREYKNGVLTHTSRNAFIPLVTGAAAGNRGGLDVARFAILAQALTRCPFAKDCADLSAVDSHDLRHVAIPQKTNMLDELMAHAILVGDMRPSKVAEYAEYGRDIDLDPRVLMAHGGAMQRRGRGWGQA